MSMPQQSQTKPRIKWANASTEATAQRGYTGYRTSKRELRRATDGPAPISSRQRRRRSLKLTSRNLGEQVK